MWISIIPYVDFHHWKHIREHAMCFETLTLTLLNIIVTLLQMNTLPSC